MTDSSLNALQRSNTDEKDLESAFNRSELVDRCAGNQALARELATLFLGNVDRMVNAVAQAVERRDAVALERAAHGLKGMVANFGAETAVARAFEMECLGRRRSTEDVRPQLEKLEESIATLSAALRQTFAV